MKAVQYKKKSKTKARKGKKYGKSRGTKKA